MQRPDSRGVELTPITFWRDALADSTETSKHRQGGGCSRPRLQQSGHSSIVGDARLVAHSCDVRILASLYPVNERHPVDLADVNTRLRYKSSSFSLIGR